MKQFTFLQEGSNRILSKVQKSFWSCTHVNSCQNYALYINLNILLNILCKTTLNIQESRKFHQKIEKKQDLIKKLKFIVSCYHMNYCLRKLTTHQFTYFIYYLFQDHLKNAKMMKIQQVHQKIHTKQFLLFYLNCFLLVTHLIVKRLKKRD